MLASPGLNDLDAVVSLAGEPITPSWWGPKKRELIRSSRVRTAEVLGRSLAALDAPPKVFISASAIGYYGSRGDEILVEGSKPGTGFLAQVCIEWEQAASISAGSTMRLVMLRSGIVLSPSGGFLAKLLPIARASLIGKLGNGRQWSSWISLDDEVGAIVHAITNPDIDGPLNATSPNPVRNSELTATIAASVGRPSFVSVPAPAIYLGVGRTTAESVVLASQRVLPERLESSRYVFSDPDLAGALKRMLGS